MKTVFNYLRVLVPAVILLLATSLFAQNTQRGQEEVTKIAGTDGTAFEFGDYIEDYKPWEGGEKAFDMEGFREQNSIIARVSRMLVDSIQEDAHGSDMFISFINVKCIRYKRNQELDLVAYYVKKAEVTYRVEGYPFILKFGGWFILDTDQTVFAPVQKNYFSYNISRLNGASIHKSKF